MEILYRVPYWFSGYDAIFQLLFASVSLMVFIYSYKIYKISGEKNILLFSNAFLLITLSYVVWPLISLFTTSPENQHTLTVLFKNNSIKETLIIYFHVLLFILGLVTLVYATLKTKEKKIYYLLASITTLPILIAIEKSNLAYFIASILIFFILIEYYKKCRYNKKMLTTFIAFFFLFLSTIDLIFSDEYHIYYVGGHFLMLVSYILILGRLITIYQNGKKKRKT